ncbi:MAG: helix-hairpin-helix domain-containing protein [Desulfobacterales bacterium]|nr:helix-hairpin-helix domain-containing protein [Desulfobacterales bacterium]
MVPQKINEGAAGLLVLLLVVLILFFLRPFLKEEETGGSPRDKPLFLEIEGDVRYPAVYRFSRRPNLRELVETAGELRGGVTPPLGSEGPTFPSGTRVLIRRHENRLQVFQSDMSAFYKLTLGIPLSLNRTSEEELTAIPGIGPALAKAIVEERTRRRGFKSPDEIARIPGIGQTLYVKIGPYLIL